MRRLTALFLFLLLALSPIAATAEDDAVAVMQKLMNLAQTALDSDEDLLYEKYEDAYYYELVFESSDGMMGDLYAFVDIYSSGILIETCYEQPIPQDRFDEVLRFINLVNGDLLGGKYVVDPESNIIYYEMHLFTDFLNMDALGHREIDMVLDFLWSNIAEIDYDAMYFSEIVNGEKAQNAYAMYLADLDDSH